MEVIIVKEVTLGTNHRKVEENWLTKLSALLERQEKIVMLELHKEKSTDLYFCKTLV